ncbi:unnamed protein product [Strongylus vulgaris]|uniref:DNA-directed RNA polymerase n=1 Tax=Strongylus vulgaris TaxID=40348 RepID=A0A3P7LC01_STRVU|nr:unnamed protein product [Strongylus vulgaris]
MTLKTFHFAGVSSMNITQGIPRLKEIINAVQTVSTPLITARLTSAKDENFARQVKARIEVTTLGEICDYIEEIILPNSSFILLKLSLKRIKLLKLEVTMSSLVQIYKGANLYFNLCTSKTVKQILQITTLGKSMMVIHPTNPSNGNTCITLQLIKQALQKVIIKGLIIGLPDVKRCVIQTDEKHSNEFSIVVEGSNFLGVLSQIGIDGRYTKFNNAVVVAQVLGIEAARSCIISEIMATMEAHGIILDRRHVLGIEAARSCIISEIMATMEAHGIVLDRRHVMLLADYMTFRYSLTKCRYLANLQIFCSGEVLGITRNGLVKMKQSVLLLASFEKTMDHLYEAAFYTQKNQIHGVSECIILGTPIALGTGMFRLYQAFSSPNYASPGDPIFMKPHLGIKI